MRGFVFISLLSFVLLTIALPTVDRLTSSSFGLKSKRQIEAPKVDFQVVAEGDKSVVRVQVFCKTGARNTRKDGRTFNGHKVSDIIMAFKSSGAYPLKLNLQRESARSPGWTMKFSVPWMNEDSREGNWEKTMQVFRSMLSVEEFHEIHTGSWKAIFPDTLANNDIEPEAKASGKSTEPNGPTSPKEPEPPTDKGTVSDDGPSASAGADSSDPGP